MLRAYAVRKYLRIPVVLHRTAIRAAQHDALNLAQSAAYSSMVSLFPALIIVAAIIALLPDTAPVRGQLGAVVTRLIPPDVVPLLEGYFTPSSQQHLKSAHALILALIVSITGAATVITTFMEGLRRAHDLPYDCWTFWGRRIRAYLLVPLSLVPLGIASTVVVFGQIITVWIAQHVGSEVRQPVYIFAITLRWIIAFTGSVGVIAVLYHMGTPLRQPWRRVLPGAITATAMWFLITLVFGWYVTRFANYTQVYGSLGAGIALLFWLYFVSLSVICGGEFNEQYYQHMYLDGSSKKQSNSTV
jgi:membrane protein